MVHLHFDRKIGGRYTQMATGDGVPDDHNEFNVELTTGAVTKGYAYRVRQGQSPTGDMYHCHKGGNVSQNRLDTRFLKQNAETLGAAANPEFYDAVMALAAAEYAAQKRVNIQIAPKDLETLKAANYKLCFAKKVSGQEFNVVWQSYHDYLVSNNFSWVPTYQLFGSNSFQNNLNVSVSTNQVNIGLGQIATLDEAGILEKPKTGGPDVSVSMQNDFGDIHPGINQLSTGISGNQVSTPIYVAPEPAVKGEVSLTPVEKVLVWFEQNIETGTMFSDARSNEIEIDLTDSAEETRLYTDQGWKTP